MPKKFTHAIMLLFVLASTATPALDVLPNLPLNGESKPARQQHVNGESMSTLVAPNPSFTC